MSTYVFQRQNEGGGGAAPVLLPRLPSSGVCVALRLLLRGRLCIRAGTALHPPPEGWGGGGPGVRGGAQRHEARVPGDTAGGKRGALQSYALVHHI